jgi:hypothetical protein
MYCFPLTNVHNSLFTSLLLLTVFTGAFYSNEYINAIHTELVARVKDLYERHRPSWEHRPLVVL